MEGRFVQEKLWWKRLPPCESLGISMSYICYMHSKVDCHRIVIYFYSTNIIIIIIIIIILLLLLLIIKRFLYFCMFDFSPTEPTRHTAGQWKKRKKERKIILKYRTDSWKCIMAELTTSHHYFWQDDWFNFLCSIFCIWSWVHFWKKKYNWWNSFLS